MAAVPQSLLGATVAFLRRHPPFDSMEAEDVAYLAEFAKLGYYPKDAVIVGPASGTVRTLWLIQRGLVYGRPPEGEDGRDAMEFSEGESFPITALLGKRATTLRYVAHEDTFTCEFDAAVVEELARRSHEFSRYCTEHIEQLLQQATARLREVYATNALGEQSMARTLGAVIRRKPVSAAPDAPLGQALEQMVKLKIGSVVVVDADSRPVGMLTERAIVAHLQAGRVSVERPVSDYMVRDLVTLPFHALVSEAAVEMARRGARYVIVTDEGRLAGIVSERDLFALQRQTMGQVTNAIATAEDREGLRAAADQIHSLAQSLLAQGIGAEQLTQLISALNDKLAQRILDLERERHSLEGVEVCWLALGSEGRHEQTLSTDQDNAVVFEAAGAEVEVVRARLLAFARAANETLDACGFPLCKGNVMASNPDLCLTLGEWESKFADWMRAPTPDALLNATIFFDFRAVWGRTALAERLREWLMAQVADQRLFLRMMAENALSVRPPLGFFGDFVTSGADAERGTIDLKGQGTRIFVDALRIQALARGVTATNTAARMRAVADAVGVKREEVEAAVDAFHFILMLRLRRQDAGARATAEKGKRADASAQVSPNRIDPRELNDLDRRILKEALRHAARIQERIKLDFQL